MEVFEALKRIDSEHFAVISEGKANVYDLLTYTCNPFPVDFKDKLDQLFIMQQTLQEKHMHYDFAKMSEQQRGRFIRAHVLYCEDELHEMLHEIPFFKDWKRYDPDPETNEAAWKRAKEEFVDALHFFLNVAIVLGFKPEELLEAYLVKNGINIRRQRDQSVYKPSADEA